MHIIFIVRPSISFVSTGEDKALRLWVLNEDSNDSSDPSWENTVITRYNQSPHDVAFRPGSGLLAVAEKTVRLYKLSENIIEPMANFNVHDKNPSKSDRFSKHMIGSMAWGSQSTANHLFVSSEPIERTFKGFHKVFEVESQTLLYQFDAPEAGDVIALDSTGTTLALCTEAGLNHNTLRLYDVHGRNPIATTTVDLDPFPERDPEEGYDGEINVATFSPDGIYLALARNDNHTHVYDRRMLSRGPLFDYEHFGESKVASKYDRYGVVNAQWIQSKLTRRMVLVTGGEDGELYISA